MKDNSNKKDVITGTKISRESLYYIILFGIAALFSLVLLVIGIVQGNKKLIIYSAIILPLFVIASALAARGAYVSRSTVYTDGDTLFIKSFFRTEKIRIKEIEKLSAAKNDKTGKTSVKITHAKKVSKYTFKNFNKEEISHLRRATSKF